MAPADVGLGVFQLLLLGLLLAQLVLVEPGAQHFPGFVAVAVLGNGRSGTGRRCWSGIYQAHRRVGLVDMLAPAGGAEGVGTHVGRIDLDLDRIIHLRDTKTEVKLVWRRAFKSKGDFRTRRWMPVSVRRCRRA